MHVCMYKYVRRRVTYKDENTGKSFFLFEKMDYNTKARIVIFQLNTVTISTE